MKTSKKRLAIILNIFFSIIGLLLNIIINMLLAPYITNNLGIEAYGFIGLANNIVGYIEIISVALNSLAARYVAIEFHKQNYKKANQYYNSVLVANLIFSLIILIPALFFIINLDNLINIPKNIINDVKILFLLVVVNYILMMVSTCFNIATFIKNRLDISALLKNFSYLIKAFSLVAIFSIFTPHVWMVTIAVIISTIFLIISNIFFTKKLTPELGINVKQYSGPAVKEIISNGSWNSIGSLGIVLNSGLDLLVTNIFLNATSMGQLSVIKSITSVFNTFVVVFTQAFRPLQLESYSKNNNQAMINEFKISIKVTGFICSITFAGLYALGYFFLKIWIPGQEISLIYKVMMIVLVGDVLGAITYPLNYIFTIINRLKVPAVVNILNGVLNVTIMLILLKTTELGLYAVVLTTAFLNIVIQVILIPTLVSYYLKLSLFTFYPIILKCIINCMMLVFIFKFVTESFIDITNWFNMLTWSCILGGIGILLSSFILFSSSDRKTIIGTLIRKKK